MNLLADLDDVEAVLGRDLDDDEVGRTVKLLQLASDAVRIHTGQQFDYVEDDEITIEPDIEGHLWLPQRPVISVSTVKITSSNTPIDTVGYGWTRDGYLARRWFPTNAEIPWWIYPLTVTYTHGYQTVPADVRLAVAELVGGSMANPSGIVSESLGVYSVRYLSNRSPGVSLTSEVEQRLRRYRRQPSSLPIYSGPFPSGFDTALTGFPTP